MPNDPAKAKRTLLKFVSLWETLARAEPAVVAFQNDLAAARQPGDLESARRDSPTVPATWPRRDSTRPRRRSRFGIDSASLIRKCPSTGKAWPWDRRDWPTGWTRPVATRKEASGARRSGLCNLPSNWPPNIRTCPNTGFVSRAACHRRRPSSRSRRKESARPEMPIVGEFDLAQARGIQWLAITSSLSDCGKGFPPLPK